MKKNFLALALLFSILNINAQNDTIPLNIRFESGIHFEPLNGISLSDTGLFAGRLWQNRRNFFRRNPFKYESVYIPYNELDTNVLYRLRILLIGHNYLKNVRSFPNIYESTGSPRVISIFDKDDNYIKQIVDYRYADNNTDDDLCYDRFLLNELTFLLNDLLPDKYSELRIGVGNRPSPAKINEDGL